MACETIIHSINYYLFLYDLTEIFLKLMSKLDCLYYLERNSVLDLIVLLIQITLILSDSFRKYSFFQNIFSDKLHKIVYTSIFFLQRYRGKIYDNFSRIFESGGIIFSKGTNYFFNKFCTAGFRLKGWLAAIIDKKNSVIHYTANVYRQTTDKLM